MSLPADDMDETLLELRSHMHYRFDRLDTYCQLMIGTIVTGFSIILVLVVVMLRMI